MLDYYSDFFVARPQSVCGWSLFSIFEVFVHAASSLDVRFPNSHVFLLSAQDWISLFASESKFHGFFTVRLFTNRPLNKVFRNFVYFSHLMKTEFSKGSAFRVKSRALTLDVSVSVSTFLVLGIEVLKNVLWASSHSHVRELVFPHDSWEIHISQKLVQLELRSWRNRTMLNMQLNMISTQSKKQSQCSSPIKLIICAVRVIKPSFNKIDTLKKIKYPLFA